MDYYIFLVPFTHSLTSTLHSYTQTIFIPWKCFDKILWQAMGSFFVVLYTTFRVFKVLLTLIQNFIWDLSLTIPIIRKWNAVSFLLNHHISQPHLLCTKTQMTECKWFDIAAELIILTAESTTQVLYSLPHTILQMTGFQSILCDWRKKAGNTGRNGLKEERKD